MLVSLELKAIADKHGVLSPELALGYRAIGLARQEFDSLDHVRAAVFNTTAARLAFDALLGPGDVSVRDCGRHAYTFCHTFTGSVLRLDARAEVLHLPACCRLIEDQWLRGQPSADDAVAAYQAVVSEMVATVLTDPPEHVFSVRRYRCRPAGEYPDVLCRFARCERCAAWIRLNRLYDVEGFLLCAACAEIEPSWFARTSSADAARAMHGRTWPR